MIVYLLVEKEKNILIQKDIINSIIGKTDVNITKGDIWNMFKEYYSQKTGKEVPDYVQIADTIEDAIINDTTDTIFDDYMKFALKIIMTKIAESIIEAIELFRKNIFSDKTQELTVKEIFAIFDRMINQVNVLLNSYEKYKQKGEKEKDEKNTDFGFKKLN